MPTIPYMPFYVSDYLADTSHLSTIEHGAYCLLIWAYWQRKGPLLASPERLAGIAKLTTAQWSKVESTLKEFFIEDGALWKHKRIDEELLKVQTKIEQNSKAGKASAAARFNVRSTDVGTEGQPRASESDSLSSSLSKSSFPEIDSAFLEFEKLARSVSMLGSEGNDGDWDRARRVWWPKLGFEQQLSLMDMFRKRIQNGEYDDPAYVPGVASFFASKWRNPPRPKPNGHPKLSPVEIQRRAVLEKMAQEAKEIQ